MPERRFSDSVNVNQKTIRVKRSAIPCLIRRICTSASITSPSLIILLDKKLLTFGFITELL